MINVLSKLLLRYATRSDVHNYDANGVCRCEFCQVFAPMAAALENNVNPEWGGDVPGVVGNIYAYQKQVGDDQNVCPVCDEDKDIDICPGCGAITCGSCGRDESCGIGCRYMGERKPKLGLQRGKVLNYGTYAEKRTGDWRCE